MVEIIDLSHDLFLLCIIFCVILPLGTSFKQCYKPGSLGCNKEGVHTKVAMILKVLNLLTKHNYKENNVPVFQGMKIWYTKSKDTGEREKAND